MCVCVCINKLFNFFGHRFADNGVGLSFARYFLCVCARACVTAGGRGGRQVTSFKKYFFLSFFISRVCVCVSVMAVTLRTWAPVRRCPSPYLWARVGTAAPTEDRINTGVLEGWMAIRGHCPETSETRSSQHLY